jgi:RNA polymerase sigma-70 factor (ECF subfamily)
MNIAEWLHAFNLPPPAPHVADRQHTTYHDPFGFEPTSGNPRAAGRGPRGDLAGSGMKRLDPEVVGAHLGPLLRTASALCDSRESAEDLVQDTVARVLSRPRLLRGGDERAYLMRALRNTFLTGRRTAGRRPRLVGTLEGLDPADRRTGARPEEAAIAGQVFPAIAQLPESFRRALVAVDIAGFSYREAARVPGVPEATITTRLYRARRRVARELDPERSALGDQRAAASAGARPADGATAASSGAAGRSTPRQRRPRPHDKETAMSFPPRPDDAIGRVPREAGKVGSLLSR